VDQFRFGEFEFDAGSGELRRHDVGRALGGEAQRLPPQPARLLHLLAARGGAIVTRDEIRQQLWPNTHVDFDTSLHFCVRQLRLALGDSAAEPRYVENVPRRGYRLVPDVTRVDGVAATAAAGSGFKPWMRVSLAIAIVAAIALSSYYVRPGAGSPRVRIAIMPIQAPIAEWILQDLSTIAGDSLGIVGPTTTSAYAGSDAGLQRFVADYGVDYILNGRDLSATGRPRLLAELIRVSDGVHVWVRPYEDLSDGRRIGQEISRNVARVLNLR
jgi:DNA-binding winged helix-turn-helix (wHTH) protein/TolB-like protein